MSYEINVSELKESNGRWVGSSPNYVHLFATHERSLTDYLIMVRVYALIRRQFPAPQFKVDVSKREVTGTQCNMEMIDKVAVTQGWITEEELKPQDQVI